MLDCFRQPCSSTAECPAHLLEGFCGRQVNAVVCSAAHPHSAETKWLLSLWLSIMSVIPQWEGKKKKRKEKSPPRKSLLPQIPRQNSLQKDMSPGFQNGLQKTPARGRSLGRAQGQLEWWCNRWLHWTWCKDTPPCKYCLQRASQLRTNMLLLHVLLLMYSGKVSFPLVFLWLAGILVLDAERHIIRYIGWKASVQNELCTRTLLGQRISVFIFAAKLNSMYSLERLFSHCTHALPMPSGIYLACGCHCSVKPSCFLFHRQPSKNTTLSPHFFCYSIAEEDSITSFLFWGMLTARDEIKNEREEERKSNSPFFPPIDLSSELWKKHVWKTTLPTIFSNMEGKGPGATNSAI